MTSVISKSDLLEQTIESRRRNIGLELERQLDMQFGVNELIGSEPMAMVLKQIQDVLDAAPRSRKPDAPKPAKAEDVLSALIERVFPFTKGKAIGFIRRAVTVDELISHINIEVG